MLSFLADIGNYEDRKVAREHFPSCDAFLSTCRVSDGLKEYETALEHPKYNSGKLIIVESYDTKEEAMEGHLRWQKLIIDNALPETIVDCMNGEAAELIMLIDKAPLSFKRED